MTTPRKHTETTLNTLPVTPSYFECGEDCGGGCAARARSPAARPRAPRRARPCTRAPPATPRERLRCKTAQTVVIYAEMQYIYKRRIRIAAVLPQGLLAGASDGTGVVILHENTIPLLLFPGGCPRRTSQPANHNCIWLVAPPWRAPRRRRCMRRPGACACNTLKQTNIEMMKCAKRSKTKNTTRMI